jgi:hypothetical protein
MIYHIGAYCRTVGMEWPLRSTKGWLNELSSPQPAVHAATWKERLVVSWLARHPVVIEHNIMS